MTKKKYKKLQEMFDKLGIIETQLKNMECNENGNIRYTYEIVSTSGILIADMLEIFSVKTLSKPVVISSKPMVGTELKALIKTIKKNKSDKPTKL